MNTIELEGLLAVVAKSSATSKCHVLKAYPRYFREVKAGNKLFEIRLNNRDYKKGDSVILLQSHGSSDSINESIPCRFLVAEITYVTDFEQKEGWVVFGIKLLAMENK